MFYRVEVKGEILGNAFNNPELPYEFFQIYTAETLDREYQPNVIYKTDNKFEYCMYLDQPSLNDIETAKHLIRQKMLCELTKIINNLQSIKEQLENQN